MDPSSFSVLGTSGRGRPWPWAAGLALLTAAVYAQTGTFEFVNFDDGIYVYESPIVKPGVTTRTITLAFTGFESANWHPLTWLSLLLDRSLFGMNPGAFHMVNVLLHIASTLVLFQTLREATSQDGRSAFVAALFAIHPLHVESVVWIAERKDVLSGLFWMITLWCYGRYARQPTRSWAAAVFGSLLLGLMAKQMLVSLPFVLVLWDVWPLRRWTHKDDLSRLWPLVREKLPLFALSLVFSVVVVIAQRAGKSVTSLEDVPLDVRISNVFVSYAMYLVKTVYPFELAVFYPHSQNAWPWPGILAAAVGLLAVTGGILWNARRRPELAVGWLWYLGTLVPVIGLVQVGNQAMADRYSYLPLIGIFLLLAWGVAWERLLSARGAAVLGVALVALLAARALNQVSVWRNSETLFEHALRVAPSSVACNNLGLIVWRQGDVQRAEELFRQAVELEPKNVAAWSNLGATLQELGDLVGAQENYEQALRLNPDHAETLTSYGNLLTTSGQFLEAQGKAEDAKKQYVAAETLLRKVLERQPEAILARLNLGASLLHQGRVPEAIAEYERVLAQEPHNVLAVHNLGTVYARLGRHAESIAHFERVLAAEPERHLSRLLLASGLFEERQYDRALSEVARVLEAEPDNRGALRLRARIQEQTRSPTP